MKNYPSKLSTTLPQYLITGFLFLVLLGLVGAYVFYGIYIAKETVNTRLVTDTVVIPETVVTPNELNLAEKLAILKGLGDNGTTTISTAEKGEILQNLGSNLPDVPEEDKRASLEQLRSTKNSENAEEIPPGL